MSSLGFSEGESRGKSDDILYWLRALRVSLHERSGWDSVAVVAERRDGDRASPPVQGGLFRWGRAPHGPARGDERNRR